MGNGPGGFGDSCLVLFRLLVRTGSDFSHTTPFLEIQAYNCPWYLDIGVSA